MRRRAFSTTSPTVTPTSSSSSAHTSTVALAAVPMVAGGRTVGGYLLYFDVPAAVRRRPVRRPGPHRTGLGTGLRQRPARRGPPPRARSRSTDPVGPDVLMAEHGVVHDPAAVGEARRFLRRTLGDWEVEEDTADTAVLCLSELVTNALIHSHAGCAVRVQLEERRPHHDRAGQRRNRRGVGRVPGRPAAGARSWATPRRRARGPLGLRPRCLGHHGVVQPWTREPLVDQQRDAHLDRCQRPVQPHEPQLVGEVGGGEEAPVVAGRGHHVAEAREHRRRHRAEPAPVDRLVTGSTSARSPSSSVQRAATSGTAPPAQ